MQGIDVGVQTFESGEMEVAAVAMARSAKASLCNTLSFSNAGVQADLHLQECATDLQAISIAFSKFAVTFCKCPLQPWFGSKLAIVRMWCTT